MQRPVGAGCPRGAHHGQDRRDADSACDEDGPFAAGRRGEGEGRTRSTCADDLAGLERVGGEGATSPAVLTLNRDAPAIADIGVGAQRVLALEAAPKYEIDVRTRLPVRQGAAVRGGELERNDPFGDGGAGGEDELALDVAEEAHAAESFRAAELPCAWRSLTTSTR